MDELGLIMGFEQGTNTIEENIELFSSLIKSGRAWTLQGMYGRTASRLIDDGFISKQGEPDWDAVSDAMACDGIY